MVRRLMHEVYEEEVDDTLVGCLLGEGDPPEEVEGDRDDDCGPNGQKLTCRCKGTFPMISAAIAEHEAAVEALDEEIDLYLENKRLRKELESHGITLS